MTTHHSEPVRSDRGGIVAGLVIIAVGVVLLAVQFVPNAGVYVPLGIGLTFLIAFAVTRLYGLLIPGAIVTAVGAGTVLVTQLGEGDAAGGVFLVTLALGFAAIYVLGFLMRLRENHWWPLIPAGILAMIGTLLLGGQVGLLALLGTLWPVILVLVGVVLLIRAIVRPA